jgi:hypothetical protein
MEILTAVEVAAWLRISRWQVYELAKARTRSGDVRQNPLLSLLATLVRKFAEVKEHQ